MKLFGLKPYKRKARWKKRKDFGKPDSGYPNLIKRQCPIKPNIFWAGDFTRLIWFGEIVYLATFIDIYTREIVGWSVSTKHTNELVIEAFIDGVINCGRPKIVHTDQGSEYQSKEYINLVESLSVKVSMSKKGSPWENGYQETWYDKFKTDLGLEFERFETTGEFVEAIHYTINKYNTRRIQRNLKMSPREFKEKYLARLLV